MGQLNLEISSRRDDASLKAAFETPGTIAKHGIMQKIVNFLTGLQSGSELGPSGSAPAVAISVEGQKTAATGTFTLASVVATDAISINGVTFTGVASGATGNQFNIGASDADTATNLAAAINASATALVSQHVTASAASAVVTITSAIPGVAGNAVTIASADATITASGARLTGGAEDASAITLSF